MKESCVLKLGTEFYPTFHSISYLSETIWTDVSSEEASVQIFSLDESEEASFQIFSLDESADTIHIHDSESLSSC